MILQSTVLCEGQAQGEVLRLDAPISFWGGVDPSTSIITLAGHPQFGEPIKDKILVIPELIGSSSSSAVMLELLYSGAHPKALILGAVDAILPIGVVVAQQMGWQTIPVVVLSKPNLWTGDLVAIAHSGEVSCASAGN